MAHGRGRVWAKRIGLAVGLFTVSAGGYAVANRADLNARYAGHRFRSAGTPEARAAWAETLLAAGPRAIPPDS